MDGVREGVLDGAEGDDWDGEEERGVPVPVSPLRDPVVLFVHPWEFVDLTRERLRYDCRFRTGDFALRALREVIELFQRRGATFLPMRELVVPTRAA